MKKGVDNSNVADRTPKYTRILVIEDDQALSHTIQTRLRRLGFHTEGVSDGAEAIDWLVNNEVTLALLDYRLPDMSGEQVMKALAKRKRTVPFIVITGQGDEKVAVEMMNLGARDYLVKDTAFFNRLSQAVERTIEQLATEDKLAEAERALWESEGKYRTLLETSAAPVYWVEVPGGEITFINKKAEDLFGRRGKDLLGHKLFEFVPEDEVALHQMKEAAREMKIKEQPIPQVIIRPGGELRYTEVYPTMFQSEGKIIAQVICPDITERKRAEEELRASEEKIRLMFEAIEEGITVTDLQGSVTDVNEAALRMHGFRDKEEAVGRSAFEFISAKDRARAEQNLMRTFEEGVSGTIEYTLLTRDGEQFDAELNAALVRDSCGNPAGFIAVTRDITERKRAEEAIKASEEKYRALVEDMSDGYMVIRGNKVLFANKRMSEALVRPVEDIKGRTFMQDLTPESLKKSRQIYERTKSGKPPPDYEEFELHREDGGTAFVGVRFKETIYEGELAYSLLIGDITERKRAEEEIKRHAKRAEALHAVAQAVSQTLDLDDMLSNAMDTIKGVMEVDVANVYLLDEGAGELTLTTHKGVSNEFIASMSILKLDQEEIEKLHQWKEPTIALERALNQPNLARITQAVQNEGLQSRIVVPLWLKGVVSGAIALACRHPCQYSAEDIDLLLAIGNEIAVGIENAQLLERTRELSVTDELTELYNRRHFYQALEAEIDRAQRYGHSFCLAMIDLDSFKEYNDRFGHLNGDAVLRSLARMLKSSLRKSDMAFRYGGDEFTIILPVTEAYRARKIVDRVRLKWLEAPKSDSLVLETPIGFSAGIAQFPQDAGTADGLVFLADTALYHSKRQGGYKSSLVSDLGAVTLGVLDSAMLDHVYALAATVDARDPFTYGHSERVAHISETIGKTIGLSMDELVKLHAAALLHDIGKVGVPDSILTKPGRLTKDEWRVMERHPVEGARIVGHVTELAALVPMIRHHHEWYDGTGYPDRLKGEDIPLGARIISIADAYDTMTTQRPYRDTVSEEEALDELRRCCGTQFDLELVESFCGVVEEHNKRKIRVGG